MTNIRTFCARAVFTIAVVALGLAGMPQLSQADILNDFQVTPSALTGPAGTVTADKIVGAYGETFTVTGADTFTTDAWWYAGQFVANDGLTAVTAGVSGLGTDYELYALFSADGTFSTDLTTGVVTFTATSGSLDLWADYLDPQTTFLLPLDAQTGDVTVFDAGDDALLATAPLFFGQGVADPNNLASGNFEIIFQPFLLTTLGESFFTGPDPFYSIVNVAGQFNFFTPSGSTILDGSADAFFASPAIPEPASLILLGSGLLGLAARRRRAAK